MRPLPAQNTAVQPLREEAMQRATSRDLLRLKLARWLYAGREGRPKEQGGGLYGEPSWDLLLDLYIHQLAGKRVSVTDACIGCRAPQTTAIRYIDLLCRLNLAERVRDEVDGRRTWIRLPAAALEAMHRYVDAQLAGMWNLLCELWSQDHAIDSNQNVFQFAEDPVRASMCSSDWNLVDTTAATCALPHQSAQ